MENNNNEDLSLDFEKFNRERLLDQLSIVEKTDGQVIINVKRQPKKVKTVPNNSVAPKAIAMALGIAIFVGGATSTVQLKKDLNKYNYYCEKNNMPQTDFASFIINGPSHNLCKVKIGDETYLFANAKDAQMFEEACIIDNYEMGIPTSEENKQNYYNDNIDNFYEYLQEDSEIKNSHDYLDHKYNESNRSVRG